MRDLKTALALDWDVLARIEQDGLKDIDTDPFYLYVFLFHLYLYSFTASVISKNHEALSYIFYNDLYDFSFSNFIRLFW